MKKFNIGLIGLGRQASEDHIPAILSSDLVDLKAICDIDNQKVKEYERKLNVNGYTSYIEMINKEDLDFVIIVTPHYVHKDIIKNVAQKGIHILKEKPFAENLKDAFEIKQICDKNNIKLMVTLQRRFNPIYNSFFQLLDQIGKVSMIEMKYAFFVENPHEGWRGKKETSGGGCILDMGYHIIDMLLWYFGLPDGVYAELSSIQINNEEADVEDEALVVFNYNKGINGSLILSRYYSPKTEYIKVVGSKGIIEVQRGKITRYTNRGEVIESLIRENSWPTAASNQIDFFCKVISGGKENPGGPNKHLEHMAFIESCYLSNKEGRKINPLEILNGR